MPDYKFHLSKHFCERCSERNVSVEAAKNVVKYPDTSQDQYRGQHGGKVKMFTKRVDNRTLTVVAEIMSNKEVYLMTAL